MNMINIVWVFVVWNVIFDESDQQSDNEKWDWNIKLALFIIS